MRLMKKVTAVGLVAAMTITGTGFTAMAGNYSNADTVLKNGIGGITQKLYDSSQGSLNITNLQVPTLAYDDTSIGLVWEKPEQYANIADYNVYINGEKQSDTARSNFAKNAEWTNKYMESFYSYYTKDSGKSDVDMVNVDVHSYRSTGLKPDTEYKFSVVAVDSNGKEMGTPQTVTQKTTTAPEEFNINDYGAKTSEGYTSYNDEINSFIEGNTKAIQSAIDACTPGGKVVIPEGIYVTGALWLKSDMTLEINGTLWASPNSDHFEIGFLMYPFYTDTRSWGILNAISADQSKQMENIRITGNGNVYGNGWKYGAGDKVSIDGLQKFNYALAGDVDTSVAGNEKYALPRWVSGSNNKVFAYGVLAADSAKKYLANVTNADGTKKYSSELLNSLSAVDYSSNKAGAQSALETTGSTTADVDLTNAYATRSSLIIMRNVNGVYIDDIRVENPSNHTINILDSDNIAVNNVKALSYDCNNGDGIGFGCSQNVVCWNNFCDTGDDSIGFGSSVGKGAQDCNIQTNSTLWIFDNYLHEGHGGAIAAGSHTGNGITDVLCEDNVMNHTDMPFRFKSAPTNGGYISNITIRDCAVADANQVFVFTTSYSDPNSASSTEASDSPGQFHDFVVYNVTANTVVQNTICVYADVDPIKNTQKPWHTHYNMYYQDVTFGNVGGNGGFKYYNGWDTLTGCENAVFYDVNTVSYNSKAVGKGTDVAWSNIKFCKNIKFLGTTMNTLNASTQNMTNAMVNPAWTTGSKVNAVSNDKGTEVALDWSGATAPSGDVIYGVETYVGNQMVDEVDGLIEPKATIKGLSSGVEYTYKVYATENSKSTNDKATCYAIVNKTEGPSVTLKTNGEKDTTAIAAPSSSSVTLTNPIYTCAQAGWTSATTNDARVRGYRIYVDGQLNKTFYNYQLKGGTTTTNGGTISDTFSQQVGRLTPGVNNTVQIVAFTDSGVEYKYDVANTTTLANYDYKAPVFSSSASLNAERQSNGDVVLTWNAATDDTAVNGYRVYVDGKPVFAEAGQKFTPINGQYTTNKTTYTVSGLDKKADHTFAVQAGDTWWKAAQTMGTFDKMAGYNWTLKGLLATLKAVVEEPTTEAPTQAPTQAPTTQKSTEAQTSTNSATQAGNNQATGSDSNSGANAAQGGMSESESQGGTAEGTVSNSTAQTGDTSPLLPLAIASILSLAVVLAGVSKRYRNNV